MPNWVEDLVAGKCWGCKTVWRSLHGTRECSCVISTCRTET